MTATQESSSNDRIVLAMSTLGLLAIASVALGFGGFGFVDAIVDGIHWVAKNAKFLRQISNGILQLARGLAGIL